MHPSIGRFTPEEQPFRAGQDGILDLPAGAVPQGKRGREAWAASSYSFVQLADPQLGLAPSMRRAQWMRRLRCLVRTFTLGLRDGTREIPVPLLEEPNFFVSESSRMEESPPAADDAALYALEISLCERAVYYLNRLTPKPAFAVVCGDLVHAFPDKQPALHAKQGVKRGGVVWSSGYHAASH